MSENAQHSSKSPIWYTPIDVIDAARQTMDSIVLDPATDTEANKIIRAQHIFTESDNGLSKDWMVEKNTTILLNPPGGKINNKSVAWLFWDKLMSYYYHPHFHSAIFIGFNTSILRTSQQSFKCCMDFPICYPKDRLRFIKPQEDKNSPTHDNVIVFVPGDACPISDKEAALKFEFYFTKFGKVKL